MRGLWSTLALILVLAGLGAYIYFVDSERPASPGIAGEPPRTKVFSVEADKINEIRLTYKGQTSLMRKDGSGWKLIEHYDPPRVELFDLAADPAEGRNVAASRPEIRDRLLERLHAALAEAGTKMHTPNPAYPGEARR